MNISDDCVNIIKGLEETYMLGGMKGIWINDGRIGREKVLWG